MRVNEYYNQANRYYENFRQLEGEMNAISSNNEATLKQSFDMLAKLRAKVKGAESQQLILEIENKLQTMEQTNSKFTDEIELRQDDEKTFLESQKRHSQLMEHERLEKQ